MAAARTNLEALIEVLADDEDNKSVHKTLALLWGPDWLAEVWLLNLEELDGGTNHFVVVEW